MKRIRKRTTVLIILAAAILLCAAAAGIPNAAVILSAKNDIRLPSDAPSADCILILGAGVRPDGSPSRMLQERLDMGYRLYAEGKADKILCSGDHGQAEYDEVGTMKRYLMKKGVPDSAVFMDHAGFSTYDSLYRAKYIFECKSAVVVTQRYHLYRALYVGNALGISCTGVDAQEAVYHGQTVRDLREAAARTKDFYKLWRKPRASVMGDIIPVSGDGSVTNDKEFEEYAAAAAREGTA